MSRIPISDDDFDPTDHESPYLDDSDFDDHSHELDFDQEFDPFEIDDATIEDERNYGFQGGESP